MPCAVAAALGQRLGVCLRVAGAFLGCMQAVFGRHVRRKWGGMGVGDRSADGAGLVRRKGLGEYSRLPVQISAAGNRVFPLVPIGGVGGGTVGVPSVRKLPFRHFDGVSCLGKLFGLGADRILLFDERIRRAVRTFQENRCIGEGVITLLEGIASCSQLCMAIRCRCQLLCGIRLALASAIERRLRLLVQGVQAMALFQQLLYRCERLLCFAECVLCFLGIDCVGFVCSKLPVEVGKGRCLLFEVSIGLLALFGECSGARGLRFCFFPGGFARVQIKELLPGKRQLACQPLCPLLDPTGRRRMRVRRWEAPVPPG
jgi:hypothetical protein